MAFSTNEKLALSCSQLSLESRAKSCRANRYGGRPCVQAKTSKKVGGGAGSKRSAEDDIEDPEVRKRLAALKGAEGLD